MTEAGGDDPPPMPIAGLGESARLLAVAAVGEAAGDAAPPPLVQNLAELPLPPVQNVEDALPLPPAEEIVPLLPEEVRGESAACPVLADAAMAKKNPPPDPGHVLPGGKMVLLARLP